MADEENEELGQEEQTETVLRGRTKETIIKDPKWSQYRDLLTGSLEDGRLYGDGEVVEIIASFMGE